MLLYFIVDEYHERDIISISHSALYCDFSLARRKLEAMRRSSNKYHIFYLLKVDTSSLECVA